MKIPMQATPRAASSRLGSCRFLGLVLGLLMACVAGTASPDQGDEEGTAVRFWVTKGKGVKVCEAYAARLSRTKFSRIPHCDRPEVAAPGFLRLERVPLTPAEIVRIGNRVGGFLSSGDQNARFRDSRWADFDGHSGADALKHAEDEIRQRDLQPFRIRPEPDVDNDGLPDEVVIWRGERCGEFIGESEFPQKGRSSAIVLSKTGEEIDEARTRAVFGHPSGGYPVSWVDPDTKKTLSGFASDFRPIGPYIGLFSYRRLWYFDTFFHTQYGDFKDQRRDNLALESALGVFKHQSGKTAQVCELQHAPFPN
jgi:hypothetical protein